VTVHLLDLSHNNGGTVDFHKVKAGGYDAVILKATQASSFVDPAFHVRAKAAKAAGLIVGAYHFAGNGRGVLGNVHTEYDHFAATIAGYEIDVRVLDIEVGADPSTWASIFRQQMKPTDWTYSTDAMFRGVLRHQQGTRWVARVGPGGRPGSIPPHNPWTIWQNSWTTRVPGVPGVCDTSIFRSSLLDFQRLLGLVSTDHPHKPPSGKQYGWVEKADNGSVYTFAHRRGVTGKQVLALNPGIHPFALRLHQRLRIRR